MAQQAVALENRHAFSCCLRSGEIDESIPDIRQRSLIERNVKEIKGSSETEKLKLVNKLGLRTPIGNVTDHQGGRRRPMLLFRELLGQINSLGNTRMTIILHHPKWSR